MHHSAGGPPRYDAAFECSIQSRLNPERRIACFFPATNSSKLHIESREERTDWVRVIIGKELTTNESGFWTIRKGCQILVLNCHNSSYILTYIYQQSNTEN